MPEIDTRQFGTLSYAVEQIVHFPAGLPGFEDCRDYLLHEESALQPFLFLQSLTDANLNFVTLPVERLEEDYELTLSRDDLQLLALPELPNPADITCLAILQLLADGATANLAAPVVIAHRTPQGRRGTQSIRQDRRYSASHPVRWKENEKPEGGA